MCRSGRPARALLHSPAARSARRLAPALVKQPRPSGARASSPKKPAPARRPNQSGKWRVPPAGSSVRRSTQWQSLRASPPVAPATPSVQAPGHRDEILPEQRSKIVKSPSALRLTRARLPRGRFLAGAIRHRPDPATERRQAVRRLRNRYASLRWCCTVLFGLGYCLIEIVRRPRAARRRATKCPSTQKPRARTPPWRGRGHRGPSRLSLPPRVQQPHRRNLRQSQRPRACRHRVLWRHLAASYR